MSARVRYEETLCQSALNKVRGMEFRWSLNPYRGCVHGCHYCFARRYHSYFDLNTGDDFTSIIFVKTNVAHVLRKELSRSSWTREPVAVGTATDPYQPIEGKYRLTRKCLEAFVDYKSPVRLVTKGTMIIRDIDILSDLTRLAGATVCFSLTTMDIDLARKLEPGTPPPAKRMLALERLAQAGVNAGVLLAPIIPGITDNLDNLEAVVRAASSHGARFLSGQVLHLKEGTRDHFLSFLQREYPDLLPGYLRLYSRAYVSKGVQEMVMLRVGGLQRTYNLTPRTMPRTPQPPQVHQLSLPIG